MANKLLIAEDHPMTLKGLRLMVEFHFRKETVYAAGSCRQLMKELATKNFSHLILDIMLADGSALEVIPTIRGLYPPLEIMIFSGQPSSIYRRALLRYRIEYILSKDTQETDTVQLIRQFLNNEKPGYPSLASASGGAAWRGDRAVPFAGMPAREIDVLHYLLKGWRTNQIAETLNLSVSTISTLKARIFERTQTNNIKELMDLAAIHQVV